jgi:hypothetical protein
MLTCLDRRPTNGAPQCLRALEVRAVGEINEEPTSLWRSSALSRRTLLRGGLLGGVGLAAAALIGCGDDDDDDDDDTTAVAPTSAAPADADDDGADTAEDEQPAVGEGMLVQDPDLPYPYQFPEPAGTPKPGGTMVVGVTFDVVTFDPTKSAAGGTITVPNMVYNRLLGFVGGPRYDPFTLELEPELASSWERTPDGATFTFHLRDDVKWQNLEPLNGRPFVAQDVKFAYDRYAAEGVHQSYWANISSTEAVDDHTFRANMGKVTADFILPLAGRYQTIAPPELVEDESIDTKPVGTGPMIMTEADTVQGDDGSLGAAAGVPRRPARLRVQRGEHASAAPGAARHEPRHPDQPDAGNPGRDPVRDEPLEPEVPGRAGAPGDHAVDRHRADPLVDLRRPGQDAAAPSLAAALRRGAAARQPGARSLVRPL